MSTKNSNGTIGNRTRDLRACSAVPLPTAPSRIFFLLVDWFLLLLLGRYFLEVGLGWDTMDWINLAHNSDQCRSYVNMVINLPVP